MRAAAEYFTTLWGLDYPIVGLAAAGNETETLNKVAVATT